MSNSEANHLRRPITLDSSDDEEASAPKRPCNQDDSNTCQSADRLNTSTSDEGSMCTICYNDWTQTGPHRIISLKCGHLFGQSCIEKWFSNCSHGQKPRCPQCNAAAKKSDIRHIYAKSIRAIDTSEKESFELTIRKLKEARCEAEKRAIDLSESVAKLEKEVQVLKEELINKTQTIETMRSQLGPSALRNATNLPPVASLRSNSTASKALKFRFVSKCIMNGKSRCMATSKTLDTIAVSAASGNSMFPGFGFVRISAHDLKQSDFIHLHKGLIKEMVFKPNDAILLSASFDKTLKLSSPVAKKVVSTIQLGEQGHSCCWNRCNSNICYVGLSKGVIAEYDIRKSEVPVNIFSGMSDKPVTSVQFVSPSVKCGITTTPTGLLGCSLDKCYFYELNHDQNPGNSDFLPLDGKCLPLHFDHDSAFGLISHRPTTNTAQSGGSSRIVHTLFELNKTTPTSSIDTSVFRKYHGGSVSQMMPRSRVFMHPDSFVRNGIVFAADEENKGFLVWDTASPDSTPQILRSDGPVLDIDLVTLDQRMQIATLTESSLSLYERIP